MIFIESKKRKEENILKSYGKKYPHARIILCDVTSRSDIKSLQKLSPFYPHGGIPVPFSEGWTAMCVEAIWQGLKVFEHADIDTALFQNATMKNIKRTVRRFGMPLGHRKGVDGQELLGYLDARNQMYIPTYRWMLENKARHIVERMRDANKDQGNVLILLDYNTNSDPTDPRKPLSHAYLVKAYVEGLPPYEDVKDETVAQEGNSEHIYIGKRGRRYTVRISKKTGKSYKHYLSKEEGSRDEMQLEFLFNN